MDCTSLFEALSNKLDAINSIQEKWHDELYARLQDLEKQTSMLQPVAKVVEASYLNKRQLFSALLRIIFPPPPFPMLPAKQCDVQNLR